MNHSKEFWNLVEYYMPNYKQAKQELCGWKRGKSW
jgi:predicted metal-dependent hydrolase